MFLSRPKRIDRTGDDRPASNLVSFMWRMSGWYQLPACALALMVAGLTVVPLELQRRIIDDALSQGNADLLMILALIYLGVITLNAGVKFTLRIYQGWLAESVIAYCRRHIIDLHGRQPTGDGQGGTAVSIVNHELEAIGGFVGDGISDPLAQVGVLLAIVIYMVTVEPMIALVSVVFLGPQIVLIPVIQRKLNALVDRRIDLIRSLSEDVAERSDDADDQMRTDNDIRRVFGNRMRFFVWKFLGKVALNFLNAAAPLMVLGFGGWMVVQGQTEVGVIVAFISGFNRMAEPLRDLINYYRTYAQTEVKHDKVASWMDTRA
ncbi:MULTISPECIES: ABC transporter transmembrane domain-containing protein [Thalassobaculum]|uniref:ABC transporter transmembrane region n=1 Tax=Thalassobaculum litoreum DSM 18839 TaxID=1123362 RepID=A0A8G2BDY2_9PROT|nr:MULTISPECIES: ABC transporter ATP-binding protein [Thalassobaculum]SDF09462.1 ABC transporter transmembrane region [Thalassobaculum litoreum DSM 18839]